MRRVGRVVVAVAAIALGAAALTACGGTTPTEPAPARVTVTAQPPAPAAETPAEAGQWPTVAQTWEASDGGEAEPVQESNCGLTCPGAPDSPDWTTIPVQLELVESYAPMPDITETPEVDEGGEYAAE